MKLDLNEVATNLGKHLSYTIDEPPIVDPDSGLTCVEPIRGSATFTNTGRHIVVRGDFSAESGYHATIELMKSRPDVTVIFAGNDTRVGMGGTSYISYTTSGYAAWGAATGGVLTQKNATSNNKTFDIFTGTCVLRSMRWATRARVC